MIAFSIMFFKFGCIVLAAAAIGPAVLIGAALLFCFTPVRNAYWAHQIHRRHR